MARKLRLEYPGAIYHVINRGDRREAIFADDADRQRFLQTLSEACAKTQWQVHAYCLMTNHFHLLLETPLPNLVVGMKWFLGTYTSRFNRRHKLFGHLFSGRYKALVVDGSGNGYLRTVCDYVHLNPVRAKLLSSQQRLKDYPWSSYPQYLKTPRKRPGWLRVDRLLGEMRIAQDSAAGRRQLELNMEQRRAQETAQQWKALRRGWYLGDNGFREELLAQMEQRFGQNHYGEERQQSAEQKAQRLVRQALLRWGWEEMELGRRPGRDPKKLQLALRLRQETTVSLAWVAARLQIGSAQYLSNELSRMRAR